MNFAEADEGSAEISINRRAAEGENDGGGCRGRGRGQSPCGLRVNPKKTNNFSDTGNTCVLKGCKGFHSLKAVCRHMACHSRNSDTTGVCCKNSVTLADMEDEEQEQQEVALCLMMLSRGSACNNDLKCASNGGQFV
ncbi:hypothetical protein Goklo_029140 [Gossypium klotzschianum]|uniref:C2H2-type domain-containing protein n=1 Tax=Gossypium klotzschianum TaxID=34286 RepID=A0A7J8WA69_9ROSI|nr:hypothetical protein [Gossypium klotzschianum]